VLELAAGEQELTLENSNDVPMNLDWLRLVPLAK
jgi:hypothetical protein